MSVRALIFDFGGVLYMPPDGRWLRRWQGFLGLKQDGPLNELFTAPEKSEYLRKVFTGEIPEQQVWAALASRWHVSPWLLTWMRRSGFRQKRFNRELAAFIQSVRGDYRTAILSNAGDQDRRLFNDAYHIDRLVDLVIISAEEGMAKPDERLYHLALERLGVAPKEAVFVDDLEENVAAALRVGIRAIRFVDTAQVIHDIKSMLNGKAVPPRLRGGA